MKFLQIVFSLVCYLATPPFSPLALSQTSASALPAASSTRSTQSVSMQAPQARLLHPNTNKFPRGSLHDFSELLDAPAGKYGFLQRKGAHFEWEKTGKRAKFWGINVANSSLQESDADIARMVTAFREAGFNLVRLHHFDERDGIIDLTKPDSRHFNAARLRKLDWWVYQCKKNGIYVYLDLLDYRRFKEGDGVPNAELIGRAARPYNVFNKRLIELQKEYARMLLRDHKNRYTKLSYANDPAVVMLEIYDESGLFMKRGLWRQMPPPYADEFRGLWNKWLRARYGTTSALRAAWGERVLDAGENLESGTVQVPAMGHLTQLAPEDRRWADDVRRADGGRFAYDTHVAYLGEMKAYLRSIGFRVPVSITGRFEDIAELKAITAQCDFAASNFYYDHPYWGTGKPQWASPSYFQNRDPLRDTSAKSFAPTMSLGRAHGLPFVVREWNYCWPNDNRASGMIEAAAYASLHDMDALILFTYETVPTPRVNYFNVRNDPSRWNLVGVASQIFLKGLVAPSKNKIVVPYNDVDTFVSNEYSNPIYSLGWNTRVENDFYDSSYNAPTGTTLIFPPGRSGTGTFTGAPGVLWTQSLARDTAGNVVGAPQYLDEYLLAAQTGGRAGLTYSGILFPRNTTKTRDLKLGLPLALLRLQHREVVGVDEKLQVAHGFIDRTKKRLVFGSLEADEMVQAGREALRLFRNDKQASSSRNEKVAISDTGELRRDANRGQLQVSTPQFQALCGDLSTPGQTILKVSGARRGVIIAMSLDGLPLSLSKKYLVKMVTNTRNRDQGVARDPRFLRNPQGQWKVTTPGRGPVETGGEFSNVSTTVRWGNRVLDVWTRGGVWELLVDGAKQQFYCDVADARFRHTR